MINQTSIGLSVFRRGKGNRTIYFKDVPHQDIKWYKDQKLKGIDFTEVDKEMNKRPKNWYMKFLEEYIYG